MIELTNKNLQVIITRYLKVVESAERDTARVVAWRQSSWRHITSRFA